MINIGIIVWSPTLRKFLINILGEFGPFIKQIYTKYGESQ